MEQGDGQDHEEPVQGKERAQDGGPKGERKDLGRIGKNGDGANDDVVPSSFSNGWREKSEEEAQE